VFEQLTTLENLELACRAQKHVFATLFARMTAEHKERITAALETIGLQAERDTRAGLLSHGQKQWLEIGMLLVQDPKVMLVDEPVAGMTHQEIDRTAELLAGLAGKRTVVVVEHDMEFVRRIARTVTVLHEGRVLAEGSMDEVQNDPKVIEVYLGS
jgi:urea transport system ATP-binding protein